jgi:hypothetical protein
MLILLLTGDWPLNSSRNTNYEEGFSKPSSFILKEENHNPGPDPAGVYSPNLLLKSDGMKV